MEYDPFMLIPGRDTLSEKVSMTHVTPAGIPVDDLTRLIGAECWTAFHKERICERVPVSVSVGFCDGRVLDFLSKDQAKA